MDRTEDRPAEESDQRPPAVVTRAAGAVLWRWGAQGREIAVVHRPRYGDWTLPKGKIDPGEIAPAAAVREVLEETGFRCVLSRFLTQIAYTVKRGGKTVDYFAAEALPGAFTANEEVDELRWMSPERAREQLSYPVDVPVVAAFERLPTDAVMVLLVRHADAGDRAQWTGDDALRPLSGAGREQRDALTELLSLYGPTRVHSAPRVRCTQTVEPLAERLGADVVDEPLLSEEGYASDPEAAAGRLARLAAETGAVVVCSQGGVVPDLVARLARAGGVQLDDGVSSAKGSVWSLMFRRGGHPNNGHGPAARLVAADYFPEARA
ncbi:NUDIX hydrolase [Salinifilum aidingensis]